MLQNVTKPSPVPSSRTLGRAPGATVSCVQPMLSFGISPRQRQTPWGPRKVVLRGGAFVPRTHVLPASQ
eukprot:4436659-Lingulodinium_polyedra.AAC.1